MDCRVKPANDDLMRTLFHAAGEGCPAPQRRLMNVMAMVGRDLDRNAALAPEHLRARAHAVERRAGAEYL